MKKLIVPLATLLVFVCADVNGQAMGNGYRTALGVKFYPGAISFKHFMQPNRAVEALGYFYNDGFRLTALYEIHGNINDLPGLKWYIGPGAHIGMYNELWHHRYGYDHRMSFGIDGVIGLDLKINKAPINLSLDWQPSFNFVGGYSNFESGWGGLGIRYTLK
jgi:hypothetical protein